jgi:tryptophan synthase
MGTTGSSHTGVINKELPKLIDRVRQFTDIPLAVGFGIATREHFETVWKAGADAVVVGSRIVSVIQKSNKSNMVENVLKYCLELSLKGQGAARIPQRTISVIKKIQENSEACTKEKIAHDVSLLPMRFGDFGGQYVPEALVDCLAELEKAHKDACADPEFWKEFESFYDYSNRPSKLYFAERLTEHAGGARIWMKREDLLVSSATIKETKI